MDHPVVPPRTELLWADHLLQSSTLALLPSVTTRAWEIKLLKPAVITALHVRAPHLGVEGLGARAGRKVTHARGARRTHGASHARTHARVPAHTRTRCAPPHARVMRRTPAHRCFRRDRPPTRHSRRRTCAR